jgi:hypothetical protein
VGARVTRHRAISGSSASERPAEVAYAESVRRFNAKRREDLCWQWLRYHEGMRRANRHVSTLIDAHHTAEIRRFEELLGLDHDEGGDAA